MASGTVRSGCANSRGNRATAALRKTRAAERRQSTSARRKRSKRASSTPRRPASVKVYKKLRLREATGAQQPAAVDTMHLSLRPARSFSSHPQSARTVLVFWISSHTMRSGSGSVLDSQPVGPIRLFLKDNEGRPEQTEVSLENVEFRPQQQTVYGQQISVHLSHLWFIQQDQK